MYNSYIFYLLGIYLETIAPRRKFFLLDNFTLSKDKYFSSIFTHDKKMRKRKAFSLIELAVSLVIFLIASAAITLAVGNAGIGAGEIRLERTIKYKLQSLTSQVAQADYSTLVDNTFTRPSACATNDSNSCITINDQSYEVTWSTAQGSDINNILSNAPSTITVTASVSLSQIINSDGSNKIISASSTAKAPSSNWAASDYSAIRINLSNPASFSGPLYLYSAKAGQNKVIAASNPIGSSKKVVIRFLTSQCGPCRISLASNGDNILDTNMLDQAASSTQGFLINGNKGLSDTNVVLRKSSKLTLNLWAHNTDGNYQTPGSDTAGSICLYLKYTQGAESYLIPGCNTSADPSRIIFNTYTVKSSNVSISSADFLSGIPTGVPLTFSTDGVDLGSSCLDPSTIAGTTFSTKIYQSGAYQSGYECTSWNWGYPKWLNTNSPNYSSSGKSFEGTTFTIPTSSSDYQVGVTWDGNSGNPASGAQSGDSLWSKIRTARAVKTSLSVTQLQNSDTSCGGYFCNSSVNFSPYPTSGRFATTMGSQFGIVYGAGGAFSLSVTDNDFSASQPITVTLQSTTSSASLYNNSQKLATQILPSGSTLISGCTSLPCSTTLYYGGSGTDYFSIAISQGAVSKVFTIGLASSSSTFWGVVPSIFNISFKQGDSQYYILNGYNFQGTLTGGVTYSTTASSGNISATSTLQTTSTPTSATSTCPALVIGQACVVVTSASSSSSGNFTVTNQAGNGIFSSIVNVALLQKSSSLSIISASSGNQGDTISIVAELKDGANVAIPNTPIYLTSVSTNAQSWTPGVKPSLISCSTASNGRCTLTLSTETTAPSGTYTYYLSSGSLTTSGTFTLSKVISKLTFDPLQPSVTQGSSKVVTITVQDGAGSAISGATVTVASKTGFTSSISGVTDANGKTYLTLGALSSARVGWNSFTVSSGTVSKSLKVKVSCLATSITSITPTATQGANSAQEFTALDANGDACPYAELSTTNTSGLSISKYLLADKDGKVTLNIYTALSQSVGTYLFSINNSISNQIAQVSTKVTPGVSYLSAQSILTRGSNQVVSFDLRDTSGNLIANLPYTVKSLNPELSIQGATNGVLSGTAAASGYINLTLYLPSSSKVGLYDLIFTINKKEYQISVASK